MLARQALNDLGATPEEIAENLKGAGFKGITGDPWGCPCGQCLREHFGVPIGVHSSTIRANNEFAVYFGPKIKAFITNFDARRYRALIA